MSVSTHGLAAVFEEPQSEAQFISGFCRAVFRERDPHSVCATAAQWFHQLFSYRLALFSVLANGHSETLYFTPKKGLAIPLRSAEASVAPGTFTIRRFSDEDADIEVLFPGQSYGARFFDTENGPRNCVPFLTEISTCLGEAMDLALQHQRLEQLSLRDSLTGLLNRRAFNELAGVRRGMPEVSLLFIDIDNFKSVNDRFGHGGGDQVIVGVAQAILDASRGSDVVARYGGEEFVILLPGANSDDAMMVAERIAKRIALLKFSFGDLSVTVSQGVACRPPHGDSSVNELLDQADKALYHAKERGKNQAVLYAIPTQVTGRRVA